MTDHILAAWADDIEIRRGPIERSLVGANGYRVNVHEISSGVVFKDNNVAVTAFAVKHGEWGPRALGYRFQTADRTIVISGDTSPSESVVEHCNGCDVLIHEVYTEAGYAKASPEWQRMRREYDTSSRQLGETGHESPSRPPHPLPSELPVRRIIRGRPDPRNARCLSRSLCFWPGLGRLLSASTRLC
jgi:Beta-lactamase superfamily domain